MEVKHSWFNTGQPPQPGLASLARCVCLTWGEPSPGTGWLLSGGSKCLSWGRRSTTHPLQLGCCSWLLSSLPEQKSSPAKKFGMVAVPKGGWSCREHHTNISKRQSCGVGHTMAMVSLGCCGTVSPPGSSGGAQAAELLSAVGMGWCWIMPFLTQRWGNFYSIFSLM